MLKGINVSIRGREKIGVVGRTGSGKVRLPRWGWLPRGAIAVADPL